MTDYHVLVRLRTLRTGDTFALWGINEARTGPITIEYQSPKLAEMPEGQLLVKRLEP